MRNGSQSSSTVARSSLGAGRRTLAGIGSATATSCGAGNPPLRRSVIRVSQSPCALATSRPRGYDRASMEIIERPTDDRRSTLTERAAREGQGADGRGARRRGRGASRRDPGRRLLGLPVRRSASTAARRTATTSSSCTASRVVVDPFSAPYLQRRDDRLPRRRSGVRASRSTTRTSSPRAAAATRSRSRTRSKAQPPSGTPAAAAARAARH